MVSSACSGFIVGSGVDVGVTVEVKVAVGGIVVEEGRGVADKVGVLVGVGVTIGVVGSGVLETISVITPVDPQADSATTISSRRYEMGLGIISESFLIG
jgi:hypothetical protein